MTKVKALFQFIDKYTGKRYFPGDIIDVDEDRADELQSKGLVEKVKGKGKGLKHPPEDRMIEEAENK